MIEHTTNPLHSGISTLHFGPGKEICPSRTGDDKSLDEFLKSGDDSRQELDAIKSQIKVLQQREGAFSSLLHMTFWGGVLAAAVTTLFAPTAGISLFAATGVLTCVEGVARVKTYNSIEKKAHQYKDLEEKIRQVDETGALARSVVKDQETQDSISIGDGFVVIDGIKLEKNKLFSLVH